MTKTGSFVAGVAAGADVADVEAEFTQNKPHGIQPGAFLIVGADRNPGRLIRIRIAELLLFGAGVIVPLV